MTHHQSVLAFNHLMVQKRFEEALAFYADDIVVTHNLDAPIAGIGDFKKWMIDFVNNNVIESIEVVSLLTEDGLSVTNWYWLYKNSDGKKFDGHRFCLQRWSGNKIVQENYFYNLDSH